MWGGRMCPPFWLHPGAPLTLRLPGMPRDQGGAAVLSHPVRQLPGFQDIGPVRHLQGHRALLHQEDGGALLVDALNYNSGPKGPVPWRVHQSKSGRLIKADPPPASAAAARACALAPAFFQPEESENAFGPLNLASRRRWRQARFQDHLVTECRGAPVRDARCAEMGRHRERSWPSRGTASGHPGNPILPAD
jgi:hypothetical protein